MHEQRIDDQSISGGGVADEPGLLLHRGDAPGLEEVLFLRCVSRQGTTLWMV